MTATVADVPSEEGGTQVPPSGNRAADLLDQRGWVPQRTDRSNDRRMTALQAITAAVDDLAGRGCTVLATDDKGRAAYDAADLLTDSLDAVCAHVFGAPAWVQASRRGPVGVGQLILSLPSLLSPMSPTSLHVSQSTVQRDLGELPTAGNSNKPRRGRPRGASVETTVSAPWSRAHEPSRRTERRRGRKSLYESRTLRHAGRVLALTDGTPVGVPQGPRDAAP
jgi:hypothetical protein